MGDVSINILDKCYRVELPILRLSPRERSALAFIRRFMLGSMEGFVISSSDDDSC